MFDHIGCLVTDPAVSRGLCAALTPGGIVDSSEWATFGKSGWAQFRPRPSGAPFRGVHLAFVAADRAGVRACYEPRSPPGSTTARQDLGRAITPMAT